MAVIALLVVGVCFLASLLPVLFPGAFVSGLGLILNHELGELLVATLGVGQGTLVVGPPGQGALSLQGVLAVYLPALGLLLLLLRRR